MQNDNHHDLDTGWTVKWIHDELGGVWAVYDQQGQISRYYRTKQDAEDYMDWVCGTYVERHYLQQEQA